MNGVTTSYVYDGTDVVREGSTYYTRGAAGLISKKSGVSVDYYYTDYHGSVVRCGDEAYSYDAFGNQTEASGDTNPFRYSGEYYDEETGLIYLRARYYDSGVGAFVSEDPAKDGLNWYSYCAGNPVMLVDSTGLYSEYMEHYNMNGFKVYSYWNGNERVYAYEGDAGVAYTDPTREQAKNYIIFQAIKNDVPISIALAVARTETDIYHYNAKGQVKVNDNGNSKDWGIMQINDVAHADLFEQYDIKNDYQQNIQAGIKILRTAYLTAIGNGEGYNGPYSYHENVAAATYSAYNAGNGNYFRYRNIRSRNPGDDRNGNGIDDRDENFLSIYRDVFPYYGVGLR